MGIHQRLTNPFLRLPLPQGMALVSYVSGTLMPMMSTYRDMNAAWAVQIASM